MSPGFQEQFFSLKTQDGRNFIFVEPATFVTRLGAKLTIPAGTTMDGASTPTALWLKYPPFGKYFRAAGAHDWVCRYTKMGKDNCDQLFYELMLDDGVDETTAKIMYDGVRLWPHSEFEKNRLQYQPAS